MRGTIDLECGSTTITFSRMEEVAFSHMIFVDGGSLLATAESGITTVKDLKSLETLQPGQDLRVKILRDKKVSGAQHGSGRIGDGRIVGSG